MFGSPEGREKYMAEPNNKRVKKGNVYEDLDARGAKRRVRVVGFTDKNQMRVIVVNVATEKKVEMDTGRLKAGFKLVKAVPVRHYAQPTRAERASRSASPAKKKRAKASV